MDRFCFCAICLAMQLCVFTSCVGGGSNGGADDGLEIQHAVKNDSILFSLDEKNVCMVTSVVDAFYPQYYKNDSLTQKLQSLYVEEVLNVPSDTFATMQDAFSSAVKAQAGKLGDAEDEIEAGLVANRRVVRYIAQMNVSVVGDADGFLTFCRQEKVEKGAEAAVDIHRYINIDLSSMSKIDIYDLFGEEVLPDVSNLLKAKLLEQSGASNEDELIAQGYFNLDNITANDNFYFGAKGVTWNYVTYEIACYSVGETQITLGYDALAPYISRNSVLYTFLKKVV